MRQFYEAYRDNQFLSPLVREISWTKNLVILERCRADQEREFYLRRTREFGWTKNVLIHQIENRTYEKTVLNQTNFEKTVPEDLRNQAKLAVKDEYTFDFYLAVLDDRVRMPGENPSIGILICKSKDRTIVEYALKDVSKPIGVATYQVLSSVPYELRNDLPSPEKISRLLS